MLPNKLSKTIARVTLRYAFLSVTFPARNDFWNILLYFFFRQNALVFHAYRFAFASYGLLLLSRFYF